MTSEPENRRPGTIPVGLIGMLVLVGLGESFFLRHPLWFSDVPSLSRRFSAWAAVHQAPGCDVLFLGDSMVQLGLLPEVLRVQTGLRAFNLAAASSPAPATFFTLRRALEAGARPSAVVLDFGPGLLAADPVRDVRNWPGAMGLREFLDLAWNVPRVPYWTSLAIHVALPSLSRRYEVRNNVRAAVRGEPDAQVEINRACRRNWLINGGALVAAKTPSHREGHDPADATPPKPGRPRFDRVNTTYVERIFDLARSRGIRVYWLLPPVRPEHQRQRDQTGVDAFTTKFVRSMQTRHPEVTVLDARRSGFDKDVFIDTTHLDVDGAQALSAAVADQIAEGARDPSAARRWVTLPHPRPVHLDRRPEDLEQSKLAARPAKRLVK